MCSDKRFCSLYPVQSCIASFYPRPPLPILLPERVYAVVGFNPSKSYAVSPETRQAILAEMVGRIGLGDRVKVTTKSGLIWRYAKQVNACLCRGIRTWKKDGSSELFLNALNVFGPLLLGPFRSPMQTVILQGDPALAHVSSTRLRKAAAEGRVGDFRGLVPQGFETKVAKQWGRPNTERKGT